MFSPAVPPAVTVSAIRVPPQMSSNVPAIPSAPILVFGSQFAFVIFSLSFSSFQGFANACFSCFPLGTESSRAEQQRIFRPEKAARVAPQPIGHSEDRAKRIRIAGQFNGKRTKRRLIGTQPLISG